MRSSSLCAVGLLAGLAAATSFASAQEASGWITTNSLINESQYGEGWTHYSHANPDAPKGGTLNLAAQGTFDSFNPYIIRGTAAAGFARFGGGLIYETLMDQSVDEPSTSHPHLAAAFSYPDDFSSATYRLNPDARWHDGVPVTPDDVVWTFEQLKEISQIYRAYYANVVSAEVLNETDIKFNFDQANNRELPKILGDMPVFPKHWWTGTNADGEPRDITEPTLEPPLGSGPYRVKSFDTGSGIVWERVPDWWGADLPVNKGRYNFDEIAYTYFLDATPIWEAFKKGGIQDFRTETRSSRWASEYNFPAFEEGRVTRRTFETIRPQPMQGFAMNQRREKFQDRRVRQALLHLFDFESVNRLQLSSLRTRTDSYFEGGELASSGLPEGRELEILEEFRDELPEEVFTTPYENPVNGDRDQRRANQRIAATLLREAGWQPQDGQWVNENGEPFTIEFLGGSQTAQIISGQFVEDLRAFGIDASLRIVDSSQYISRLEQFDFDMATTVLAQSLSPGNEQRDFWSTEAASSSDSRNLSGIENPIVDQLIDKVIFAADREELIAATHALDRVLLWNFYYIPQWHSPEEWVAWWDKFDFVDNQPAYTGVDIQSWWVKPEATQ
ncbi:MAG: extracellular solute-binding protein [Pseudomonadota bacterium]